MSKIVERTLDFFEIFAKEERPLTLSELSRLLGIPPSSCHDVLSTLSRRGYVYAPAPGAGYYPTRRLYDIANSIAKVDTTLQRAEIPLRSLRDATGETVSLARVTHDGIVTVLVALGDNRLGFIPQVGDHARAYYATAAGKAYLGGLGHDAARAYLEATDLVPLTPHTETNIEKLLADLDVSEQRGWYLNREQSLEGMIAVAARLISSGSTYIIVVHVPSVRMLRKMDEVTEALLRTREQLADAPMR